MDYSLIFLMNVTQEKVKYATNKIYYFNIIQIAIPQYNIFSNGKLNIFLIKTYYEIAAEASN
jgi:hypothetical protein